MRNARALNLGQGGIFYYVPAEQRERRSTATRYESSGEGGGFHRREPSTHNVLCCIRHLQIATFEDVSPSRIDGFVNDFAHVLSDVDVRAKQQVLRQVGDDNRVFWEIHPEGNRFCATTCVCACVCACVRV